MVNVADYLNKMAARFKNQSYKDAIIGYTVDGRIVYEYTQMIESLMKNDGMDEKDATIVVMHDIIKVLPQMGAYAPVVVHVKDLV